MRILSSNEFCAILEWVPLNVNRLEFTLELCFIVQRRNKKVDVDLDPKAIAIQKSLSLDCDG